MDAVTEAIQRGKRGKAMTREEAIQALNEIFDDSEFSRYEAWYGTAMKMAIEALQDKINEDLISRADAMSAVQDHFDAYGFKGYYDGQRMMDRINALPPAGLVWEKTSLIERKKR